MLSLLPLLAALAVMAAVFLLVIGLSQMGAARQQALTHRLQYLGRGETVRPNVANASLLRAADHARLGPLAGLLSGKRQVENVALELERAGIPLRVGEYVTLRFALAFVLFALLFLVTGNILIGLALAPIAYLLPRWYISSRCRLRRAKVAAQLEEMLTLVANSLRSGYGLLQSFEYAARQLRPPLSTELKRMLQEANLGVGAEVALQGLAERIASPDMDMVVTAITIQRTVGGNLAQILDNVAYTMRERERIRGEIRTLTAQQRMTGIIVGSLPVLVGLLMFAINPDYMSPLFTTTAGKALLLSAAGLEGLGLVLIRSILSFEV